MVLSHCVAPNLEVPFNRSPLHHVTIPFFINGLSHHHPRNPDFSRASPASQHHQL